MSPLMLPIRRLIPLLAAAAAALALPSAAIAAKNGAVKVPKATVKIEIGHLDGGRARIMSKVPVIGTLRPYAPGQAVEVSFFLNGKRVQHRSVRVTKGKRGSGAFRASIRIDSAGKYAVSARHDPTARLGGDSTRRKSWRVSFPALHQGKCGDVVVGFKKAMRKMGYIANSGRCFGGKTARGVLAYRKVNGMARSYRAGKGLVKRAFSGRGEYKVRHPDAGEHLEAPLSKRSSSSPTATRRNGSTRSPPGSRRPRR
jgi:hypothetical protein